MSQLKNFPIEYKGKTYWISPSPAVVAAIYTVKDGEVFILCNKRGEGAAPPKHLWNIPCGYLDFGETAEECCRREVLEETGLDIEQPFIQCETMTGNAKENYNVVMRHICFVPCNYMDKPLTTKYSEKNEVEDIKWINLNDINDYEWAFNHNEIAVRLFNKHLLDKIKK